MTNQAYMKHSTAECVNSPRWGNGEGEIFVQMHMHEPSMNATFECNSDGISPDLICKIVVLSLESEKEMAILWPAASLRGKVEKCCWFSCKPGWEEKIKLNYFSFTTFLWKLYDFLESNNNNSSNCCCKWNRKQQQFSLNCFFHLFKRTTVSATCSDDLATCIIFYYFSNIFHYFSLFSASVLVCLNVCCCISTRKCPSFKPFEGFPLTICFSSSLKRLAGKLKTLINLLIFRVHLFLFHYSFYYLTWSNNFFHNLYNLIAGFSFFHFHFIFIFCF